VAYTTIDKSTDYFNTKLWTGTGAENAITGVGFQPDWVWIKNRTAAENHKLYDAARGATKNIYSNLDNVEGTDAQSLKSFNSDGFTLGTETAVNANGQNIVGWNWKANGQGSSNTEGSINTTYTSANTTSGFSIVTYTGTGSNATIGHGLGAVPKMIIVKNLTNANAWSVYHASLGATKYLALNETDVAGTASDRWQDTTPTSSLFYIGTNDNQGGSYNYVAYCFAEKQGFSKFGSYVGNGEPIGDAPFIYTGFKPAFVLLKSSTYVENWIMTDNKRLGYNGSAANFRANTSNAEITDSGVNPDLLSNGFSLQNNDDSYNKNGQSYIYMAFAESPFVTSTGVPSTAG
tara:strand:- start:76 stop:1116 length:1041 start_codon:yes stop_codon:yes gene_type:complete